MVIKLPVVKDLDPQPRKIHSKPCEECPSIKGTDPECEDIKKLPHKDRLETIFLCAWRPNKLCRGYCDSMGIKQKDLK
jgi:hypothetical protein